MKKFKVQYPISEYTFRREATIRDVHFDDEHMHVELADSRTMIIWDLARCAINDEIRITDYFGPAK